MVNPLDGKKIDANTVRHMAQLSRLRVSDDEVVRFTEQLGAILDYASHLPDLSQAPILSPLETEADEVMTSENPSELLQNAVALEQGYVKVPAILEEARSKKQES